MSQELERVYDDVEVVEDQWAVWHAAKERFREGHSMSLMGQLIKAQACAAVNTSYGERTMEEFADHVGAGRSTAYALAAGYSALLEEYETHEAVFERLESSPLKITHVLKAMKAPKPHRKKALDEVEDDPSRSTRKMDREQREKSIPANVETVDRGECPYCHKVFEVSQAKMRTEAR